MSTAELNRVERERAQRQSWMAIDWAMRALSVASYAFEQAGMKDIVDELTLIHTRARARRDRV